MTDVRRIAAENRKAIWIIAVALILNAAFYVLVVYPLAQRVHTGEDLAGNARRDLNAAQRSFNSAAGTVTGKKQADEELRKFYRDVLPADQSAARRILYPHLDQLARNADLTTVRYRFDPEPDRKGGLSKLTMTLILEGEYPSVRRFIHELETVPEFLVLESVVVTQASEGERLLNVTAHVATYFRSVDNGD